MYPFSSIEAPTGALLSSCIPSSWPDLARRDSHTMFRHAKVGLETTLPSELTKSSLPYPPTLYYSMALWRFAACQQFSRSALQLVFRWLGRSERLRILVLGLESRRGGTFALRVRDPHGWSSHRRGSRPRGGRGGLGRRLLLGRHLRWGHGN